MIKKLNNIGVIILTQGKHIINSHLYRLVSLNFISNSENPIRFTIGERNGTSYVFTYNSTDTFGVININTKQIANIWVIFVD